MGLLIKLENGETALKSLKFGKDRLGGGDSGQPYIKNPILDKPGQLSQADNDFLLRGGLRAPINAAEDVARLTKYMFDLKSPSGLLFIAKQNLLSRISPKTEASKGIGYAGGALNEGVYTPLSTLAQAGVGFLGIHLNKQGIDPTGIFPGLSLNNYEKIAFDNNLASNNKIINYFPIGAISLGNAIASQPLVGGLNPFAQTSNFSNVGNAEKLSDLGIFKNRLLDIWWSKQYVSNKSTDILSYGGGPNSILGIGKTHIEFAKDGSGAPLRTGVNNPLATSDPKAFYKGGLVRPNSDGINSDRVNYNNLLGVSKKEGLTEFQTGISVNGTFSTLYNPDIVYSTLSKNNPTGQPLSGPNGYQIGDNLKYQTQESDVIYNFPIEDKLIEYGRQLTSLPQFDIGRVSGEVNTWAVTSQDTIIPKYTSRPTLIRDYTNEDVKNAGGGLWKKFNDGTATHKEGYLADLDKNSGTWETKWGIQLNNNNAYPGGIAPDFRKTPRVKRGLYELPITSQNENFDKPIPGYDNLGVGETYSEYHEKNGKLKKNTLQKIYYSTQQSSFNTSNKLGGTNDLIPFRFSIIDPTNTSNVKTLNFKAYIDNFSDAYSSEWKSQTYMGRAEKFYKYDSFGRSISLGFTIVADNPTNLGIMYSQLNTLAASLAPTYTDYGYMAGNLHKLTVGDYVSNQIGIMEGLTYEVTNDSPWDIDKNLPLYIKVTGIKFTPIHNFRPESQFNAVHQFINQ